MDSIPWSLSSLILLRNLVSDDQKLEAVRC